MPGGSVHVNDNYQDNDNEWEAECLFQSQAGGWNGWEKWEGIGTGKITLDKGLKNSNKIQNKPEFIT